MHVTSAGTTYEIVGVVKDAKYQDLRQAVMQTMYIPWKQRDGEQAPDYWYLARAAAGDPMRLAPTLEKMVREVDPVLRMRDPEAYSKVIDGTIVKERILAALAGFFGVLALLVACLGVFGSMAFQVSRRVREIGLRMALGASPGGIVGLVLGEAAGMLIAGCAIGAAAALALTGLTRKMLFGVTPTDPGLFALSAAVLAGAALAAAWLPAWRASRVDPMAALRHD